jgi:hypothetical protein
MAVLGFGAASFLASALTRYAHSDIAIPVAGCWCGVYNKRELSIMIKVFAP